MTAASPSRLLTPAFVLLAVATLAYFIADGMTLPATPLYVTDALGGDDVAVGLTVGAFGLTALILRPLSGALADRRGRRPLLIGGSALFAIGMLGHLVAVSVPLLIAMRLLLGAAEAFMFVAALTTASDLAPDDRRGEAINYLSLSLYVGIAIGPLIGEALLDVADFNAVWIAAAALAGLAVALAWRVPETRPPDLEPTDEPVPHRGLAARFLHPAAVGPGLVLLAGTWGMGGFFAFLVLHARELGLDGAGSLFLLYAGIVILLRAAIPWLPDRLGYARTAALGLTAEFIGLLILGLAPGVASLYIGTAVFGFGATFMAPALLTMAVDRVGSTERGAVLGSTSAFIDLGFGLAPAVLGSVAAAFGYGSVFAVSAFVALAGVGLLALMRRRAPASAIPA
ncbi:MAG TPA: MFS transporter [Candidatus Limnocylindria bacterium]|jgi:MFS family permease|nr:MFS transporter [Candidatus Limnocylindria bacterium]